MIYETRKVVCLVQLAANVARKEGNVVLGEKVQELMELGHKHGLEGFFHFLEI
jgi:hypothetical protein